MCRQLRYGGQFELYRLKYLRLETAYNHQKVHCNVEKLLHSFCYFQTSQGLQCMGFKLQNELII